MHISNTPRYMNAHRSDLENQNYDISQKKKKKEKKNIGKLKENNKIKQILLYKRKKINIIINMINRSQLSHK